MQKTIALFTTITILLLLGFSRQAQAQNIYTAAGNGVQIFSGDGGPAKAAQLNSPFGVAVDKNGNIYIADMQNNRVRKLSPSGIITTVAGDSIQGFNGDGGPGTSAELSAPSDIAVDASGNIYISDQANNRIRKLNSSGIISTIAGTGAAGFNGDTIAAVNAELNAPAALVFDTAGDLFIADSQNQRIRKINAAGIITTVAGNGQVGWSGNGGLATNARLGIPTGIALDKAGNLYIAESGNLIVRKVNTTGIISAFAGSGVPGFSGDGGQAVSAEFYRIQNLAIDSAGNLLIADYGNYRIRKVNTSGIISTFAGTGTPGYSGDGGLANAAQLNGLIGLAADNNGNVYLSDNADNRIRKIDLSGKISTIAGNGVLIYSGDGGPATAAQLNSPWDVAVNNSGDLYIADSGNNRIRKVNSSGVIQTVAGNGIAGFSGDGGLATSAKFNNPRSIACNRNGNLYINDISNNRIRKVDQAGVISTVAGNGTAGFSGDGGQATAAQLDFPYGIALDSIGNIYIADNGNLRIRKVDLSGIITTVAGTGVYGSAGDGGAATAAQFLDPEAVMVDSKGVIYIADASDHKVRQINKAGIISLFAGIGTQGYAGDGGSAQLAQLASPTGLASDLSGNIYIADWNNNRIRMVNAAGIIFTVAGNGHNGFAGDGSLATSAELGLPRSVAIDASGNIFIADLNNNRIRKVTADVPATIINPAVSPAWANIWPNPASDYFSVEYDEDSAPSEPRGDARQELQFFNDKGQKIMFQTMKTHCLISTSLLPNGVYIVRITGKKGVCFKKLIICR
jgi:sugar lactone lactonase YvrE